MFNLHIPFISFFLPFFMWGTSTSLTATDTATIITNAHTNESSKVQISASSSNGGDTVVEIRTPSTTTRQVIRAPKGVKQYYYSENINGVERSYSTTTPITDDDIQKMRDDQAALNLRIQTMVERQNEVFKEQQKVFDELSDRFDR